MKNGRFAESVDLPAYPLNENMDSMVRLILTLYWFIGLGI